MLKQLWMTGVLTAFSVFGIKAGLGLSAYLYNQTTKRKKKLLFVFLTLLSYFLLFGALFYLINSFNLLNYLDQFINILKYGMLLHLLIALGLLLWGYRLLLQNPASTDHISGYGLMLLFPCPVCAIVILLNLTLAYSLFSLSQILVTLFLFLIFIGIIFLTIVILFPLRKKDLFSNNSFLGLSMTFVALYFLFTVIIAPLYPKIKTSFVMASSNNPVTQIDSFYTTILLIVLMVFGGYGFIKTYFLKGKQQ